MKLVGLDHIVFTVKSIEDSVNFYTHILGFEEINFGDNRKALQCGYQKINLHQVGNELMPHANTPTSGSGDICLIYETDISHIIEELIAYNIAIEEGPVSRTGANGPITSIYIRDPDFNLIELSVYNN